MRGQPALIGLAIPAGNPIETAFIPSFGSLAAIPALKTLQRILENKVSENRCEPLARVGLARRSKCL
jgi:hypothetical protein